MLIGLDLRLLQSSYASRPSKRNQNQRSPMRSNSLNPTRGTLHQKLMISWHIWWKCSPLTPKRSYMCKYRILTALQSPDGPLMKRWTRVWSAWKATSPKRATSDQKQFVRAKLSITTLSWSQDRRRSTNVESPHPSREAVLRDSQPNSSMRFRRKRMTPSSLIKVAA